MKNILFLVLTALVLSCSTQKTTESSAKNAGTITTQTPPVLNDTVVTKADTTVTTTTPSGQTAGTLPACINKMIAAFSTEKVQNPPKELYSYTYKGNTVYYVTPECCDQFSELYDNNCNLLGHPDGGITGRGDGKFPEFNKMAINRKLVWVDKRK